MTKLNRKFNTETDYIDIYHKGGENDGIFCCYADSLEEIEGTKYADEKNFCWQIVKNKTASFVSYLRGDWERSQVIFKYDELKRLVA